MEYNEYEFKTLLRRRVAEEPIRNLKWHNKYNEILQPK